jgi:2-dehydro-3-deoxygluconokinase
MLRLSPPDFQRLEQAAQLNMAAGGSELNVAAGIARLGLAAAWVSRLPENPLGRLVRNKAREMGVDTSHVVWTKEDRLGLYFVEYGASPRASSVLYDRGHSAISRIRPGEVPWADVLRGSRLFHVSGITPALSDSAAAATAEAIRAAKAAGALVSYDLNYRAKLWSQDKARSVQTPFLADVDILITTEEDTQRVFGITGEDYREVAKTMADHFHLQVVVITLRGTPSVWHNTWSALAYSQGTFFDDVTYEVEVVDRVGSGDTFSAGFIYGYLTQDIARGLKVGNAFAALKHTSWSDFNWSTLEETEALIKGAGLRIIR